MKRDMPIDDIIAQRELEFVSDAGKEFVQVYLGKPMQVKDGPWFCPYLIKAKSFERQFRTAGEDSVQALVLALGTIPIELEVLAKNHKGHFIWFGGPDLGFGQVRMDSAERGQQIT
jgi:hypothetical protein